MKVIEISDPVQSRQILDDPEIQRLEDTDYLLDSKIIFELSPLFASNGLHYPFRREFSPEERKRLEEEMRLKLLKITPQDYINPTLGVIAVGGCPLTPKILDHLRRLPSLADCFEFENFFRLSEYEASRRYLVSRIGDEIVNLHNFHASTVLCEDLLRKVVTRTQSVKDILIENAPVRKTLRRKGDQLYLIHNAELAKKTRDLRYVFGQGNDLRQCPFAIFLIPFLERIYESSK